MKKTEKLLILLVVVLIAGLAIISCDKDSGTESGISALYGTWNMLSMHMRMTVAGIVFMDTTETPGPGEYTHVTLNENGTYETNEMYDGIPETGTGTYTIEGDSVTISDFDEEGPQTFKWNVAGNILTLKKNMVETDEGIVNTLDLEITFEKM